MVGKQLAQSIESTPCPEDRALVWPLGQLGFAIKAAGLTLMLDLYLSPSPKRRLPAPFSADEVSFADFFFGSHDHGDHIDRPVWPALAAASPRSSFIIPKAFQGSLPGELGIDPSRFIGISDGETLNFDGMEVTGVASAHEFLDRDEKTGEYPYMGFLIEIAGKRIYHPGDTCVYEGLHEKLRSRGKIDLMFLPINGRSGAKYRNGIIGNMTYQEAVDLAGSINPGLIVPCHYNMHSGNLEDPQLFADYIEAKYPAQPYKIMEPFKMYTL